MISVIVPVYKVKRYLHQCIDSILSQTYHDLEILLIDDGSPDKCGEICEEYAKKDNRIRVFHTENRGLSAARNLGLREAKGEYIGFVDSDDWIEPDMYELLLRRLQETGTGISACGVRKDFQNRRFDYSIYDTVFSGTDSIRELFYGFSGGVWNKLYKKDCWKDICFPENHTFEDCATIYKVFLIADSVSCIPKVLYHYRMRNGSIVHTRSMNNLKDYWFAQFERYSFIFSLPALKNDRKTIEKMEKMLAVIAVKTWGWTFCIPKKQRDYEFLDRVSNFARKRFLLFSKKDGSLSFRAAILLTRRTNEISFLGSYIFFIFCEKILQFGKRKKLFPSA